MGEPPSGYLEIHPVLLSWTEQHPLLDGTSKALSTQNV